MTQNKNTFGLLGKKLSHSFSKSYFTKKFSDLNLPYQYENFELEEIHEFKKIVQENSLVGLNVTVPYKEEIIPFLDELSEEAKSIGAVNCITIQKGKKIGYNTDAFGFAQMIKPFFESHHERALILGTGGASKAVDYVLKNLGVTTFFISRTKSENTFTYNQVNENMMQACTLIVNTTPVGMFPNVNEYPEIPYEFITEKHLVVDLIYNPIKTIFLQKAQAQGATILNGETMLLQQAEKSWEIWKSNLV